MGGLWLGFVPFGPFSASAPLTNDKGVRQQLRVQLTTVTPRSLTPLRKLSLLTWIGNAAAVLLGRWGAVAAQARQAGCSRQAAYHHAHQVQQALADLHAGGPSREQLLHQCQRLREENRQLWAALETAIAFPGAKQRQFAAVAAGLGLSPRQTAALLAVVLPRACCPSRATLGRWVQQVAHQAGRLLQALDQACRRLVHTLCLDEIFCRRQPVLIGVEPHSLAWLLGQRGPDRTGETWAQALAPWARLTYAVVDGGSGLGKGLRLVQKHWQQAAPLLPPLPLDCTLDNFHIQQEGQRALRREWQAAEQLWAAAEAADRRVAEADRQGRKKSGPVKRALLAWAKAEAAWHTAERREAAWQRAAAALEWFRPDGRLNERGGAEAEVAAAVADLPGERWAKARRMLQDERTLTFLDRLGQELAEAEPRPEVRQAVVELWRRQQRPRPRAGAAGPRATAAVAAGVVQTQVCRLVAADWQAAAARVGQVLGRAVRASSVVECMSSVVRMHQARHRHLGQPLLDWKRLYWNCRSFAEGKRRDHCPYEHLGLRLPTYDAWELLQWDPEALAQQLSTANVAA
jgi:hypothetical protein